MAGIIYKTAIPFFTLRLDVSVVNNSGWHNHNMLGDTASHFMYLGSYASAKKKYIHSIIFSMYDVKENLIRLLCIP